MDDSENQPLLYPTSALYETLSYESIQDIRTNGRPVSSRSTIPETASYGRNLTWTSAYILVISRVIGSGIFATPGSIVKSVGSVGLALLVWLVGTVLAACGLAVSMEFGCMLPRSGGDKVYLEYTYRRPRFLASTLIAVQAVLLGFTASNCIIFSKYTLFALSIEPTEYQQKALAVGLMTAITIVHGCFLKTGIWIQNLLGWMKIFMIAAMTLTGLWVILFRREEQSMSVSNDAGRTGYDVFLWDNLWEGSNWSWSLLSTSLFKVFYSYAGLNNVNNVLNEVQDPIRTVKSVCPSALVTACCLYLLANISYFLVVPIEEIKNSGELVGALLFERVFGPHVGRTLFPLAIAISAAGNVMVVTFAWARVNQEIARQGFLPFSSMLSSSRPFNSPLGGLIVHYIPSLLVIVLPPPGDVYSFILDVEGYPGQIFALAIAVGLLILRRRQPNIPRPFKAWLPAVWLRIVVCVALLAAPFIPPPDRKGDVGFFYATYAVVGVGILLFGVVYWYVWTVLLPRWGGYRLEEEVNVLNDGTSITKLVPSYIL
ncbi:putative methionine permease [Aspergillus fischeri NRRL 181]|uniref:Methionine permease, putative n=1 Tax=Neosartorya fischeri (strain ATCC 1020 / DSM 3700 / CBS 544.65 / FGSC A1164 / JCM 1740 / NRRL 181 / WB 181) TaxID=331117 RepID=A1D5Q4_NEOFI|nr:methionine permease, putative [Aspergillus fischeri NRRL 181]EAW21048.1 methionine permease, putative [Aspergillus fischeri NRRL 181]